MNNKENETTTYSYHGVTCDKATFDEWMAKAAKGSCPWCEKAISKAYSNKRLHLSACKSRPEAAPVTMHARISKI